MTDFATFARDHGLIVSHVIADGRVHRVPTETKPRRRNGAYAFDGVHGFVQDWTVHAEAIHYREDSPKPIRIAPERSRIHREGREAAERLAREIVARSVFQPHAYLARKGFARECGLVDPDDGRLVIPMYDAKKYMTLRSVQRIAEDGTKLFLKGGAARDAVYHIGRGMIDVLVEGFATGLSVRAALNTMYRRARIVVCFSAGNLANVARLYPRAVVIADNDASGAGEAAARKSGLRWAMPNTIGMDFNDLHQAEGLAAAQGLLQTLGV